MKKSVLFFTLFLITSMFTYADEARILQKIRECEIATGERITINGTSRTVRHQAEIMARMNDSQLNMYGSSTWYIVEMKKSSLTGTARTDEFERLINMARSQGSFVSSHLDGKAVDIAPASQNAKRWLMENGISIKEENELSILCWHLEMTGYGNY